MTKISKENGISVEIPEKNKGWVKIHRGWLGHWLVDRRKPFTKFEAWIAILLTVNHAPKEVLMGNKKILCNTCQSVKSLGSWALLFNWTISKTKRYLDMLNNEGIIKKEKLHKTIRITVCFSDIFKDSRNVSETQMKHKRNATETQATTNKNKKNSNNDKEAFSKSQNNLLVNKSEDHDIYFTEI